MDDCKRIELVAEASVHLEQFRDLMNAALPNGWRVNVIGFEEIKTKHGFLARLVGGDALDSIAILETVVAMAQEQGGKTDAIH